MSKRGEQVGTLFGYRKYLQAEYLQEARHSFITLLRDSGELSDRDLATWAGHDEEVMRTVYDKRKQVNRGQKRVADAIRRLGEGA